MGLVQTVAPTLEPVSIAQAKLWCRIDESDDDQVVEDLIKRARAYIETWTS
jgi:uncharacterized phiE125 gp8 family phage protein